MADYKKLYYIPSNNYVLSLILTNDNMVDFPDYDRKKRNIPETKNEIKELINQITSSNPFSSPNAKAKLILRLGYTETGFNNRDMLYYIVDEIIRNHRTSPINIVKELANIDING